MSVPVSIINDAFNLDGKGMAFLYKIVLSDLTTFCLSPKRSWSWQGDTYEEVPCHMTGFARYADGKMSRPKFSVVNPNGMFTSYVNTGALEGAKVTRHRILIDDLQADNNLALSQTLRVSRVASVTKQLIVLELRGALDGANFKLPERTFNPPEFPHVSLR